MPLMSTRAAGYTAAALVALGALALACQTLAPEPGQPRATLASYGVTTVEVVSVASGAPVDGSNDQMELVAQPPPLLVLDDTFGRGVDQPPGLADQYTQQLVARLQARGYRAAAGQPVDRRVSELLDSAAARGVDALLLVRFTPIDRVTVGQFERTERRLINPAKPLEATSYVNASIYTPTVHRGLLLLSTVQLFDCRTGALLFRGPQPATGRGEVPGADSDLLRWGVVSSAPDAAAIDPRAAARAASAIALDNLPARAGGGRTVEENVARRVAAVEPFESSRGWQIGALASSGLVSFPLALALGPTSTEAIAATSQTATLISGGLLTTGAHGGGIEIGYRWQRLTLTGHLIERLLPGRAGITFVRTDADAARAFPIEVGPAHDVTIDLLLGHQRLLWPHVGVRAGLGPALRLHWTAAQLPAGARLEQLGLGAGVVGEWQPYLQLASWQIGLGLQFGAGYDLAGGLYGIGAAVLRVGMQI